MFAIADLSAADQSVTDCCAVLLRGGKSRRMGRDKASLPWGDTTFLGAVASQLDFLEEKYLSVAAADQTAAAPEMQSQKLSEAGGDACNCKTAGSAESNATAKAAGSAESNVTAKAAGIENCASPEDCLSPGWIRLPDLIPDKGPLGGIYTALCSCRAEWALIVSCDIPAVKRSFFTMLLEHRTQETDIVYPVTSDGRIHMACALYRKSIAPVIRQQIDKGDNRLRVLTDLCRAEAVHIEEPSFLRMLSNINTEEEYLKIRRNGEQEEIRRNQ